MGASALDNRREDGVLLRDGKAVEWIIDVVLVRLNFLSYWYVFIVGVGPNRNTSARIPHG